MLKDGQNPNKSDDQDELVVVYEKAPRPETESFIFALWNGSFGLPMAYWAYGVLAGVLWAAVLVTLRPSLPYSGSHVPELSDIEILAYVAMAAYYFVAYVGIWKAANKFPGARIWAVLAKFAVLLVAIPVCISAARFIIE